jgi:L-lactate dehydrogenase complex protein LldF
VSGHGITTPGRDFPERTARAVADPDLQRALHNLDRRLRTAAETAAAHPEWKDRAAAVRRETLRDLDGHLDRLEARLTANGITVHRAATPADARAVVLDIARRIDARTVVKSKSMATEEIDLGTALEAAGLRSIETDLGEYIVQLAGERPSHMITPAIHKTLPQIRDVLAREAGHDLPVDREELTAWARAKLRAEFLRADLGITGVNFAAADTGTLVLVTNEGNGRYCTTLPRVHVMMMPIEKVIPRFADLSVLLPLLTSHATGQPLSNYVTMLHGPRRPGEIDGPDEMHVVFLDHRRRTLLGTPYEEMLACIRCGACLNVCPVYRNVSGHAYDAVYSGPMGKVLTPLLSGHTEGEDLPFGSTLCRACNDACPVKIPLADMIVRLRADERKPSRVWDAWARAWSSPAGYRASAAAARLGAPLLPDRALRAWTATRALPRPARKSFRARWKQERG